MVRVPAGDCAMKVTLSAVKITGISAAGIGVSDAAANGAQRLRTCTSPITDAASDKPGIVFGTEVRRRHVGVDGERADD